MSFSYTLFHQCLTDNYHMNSIFLLDLFNLHLKVKYEGLYLLFADWYYSYGNYFSSNEDKFPWQYFLVSGPISVSLPV